MYEELPSQLPTLLRLLANPLTPHTVLDLWCRICTAGWDECESILLAELQSGDPDVQRLVMEIVIEETERSGTGSLQSFVPLLVRRLRHEERVVRIVAIMAVRAFGIASEEAIACLRQIAFEDDPPLSREATAVLLDLDKEFSKDVALLLRKLSR